MKWVLIALLFISSAPLLRSEDKVPSDIPKELAKKEPYAPAWIGWLRIPKEKRRKVKMELASEEPKIWKRWKESSFKRVDWLPQLKKVFKKPKNIYPFKTWYRDKKGDEFLKSPVKAKRRKTTPLFTKSESKE